MSTPADARSTMAWFPATVGSAYRRGAASDEDLISGAAFEAMVAGLRGAADLVGSARAPTSPIDRAAGYRHLFVLLALGIDEALRPSDPYDPFFAPANVDDVLKWGMDCPDAAYTGAAIRGDATYRVRGRPRHGPLSRLPGHVGDREHRRTSSPTTSTSPDGSFELVLSPRAARRTGCALAPTRTLVAGGPAVLLRLGHRERPPSSRSNARRAGPDARPDPQPCPPRGSRDQLAALGEFLEASFRFWQDIEEGGPQRRG